MRKPPAFQCYASDILASEEFKIASLEERGLVMTMILQCWVSGSVPRNPPELAKVLGLELLDVQHALTVHVLRFFEEENGRLIRRELVQQLNEIMERRRLQSQGGKNGANQRWKKKKHGIANPIGKPFLTPLGSPEKRRVEQRGDELNRGQDSCYLNSSISNEQEIEEYRQAFGET